MSGDKHTALVEISGVIAAQGDASADKINAALQNAFKDKNTQGVILRINSPGGSPVQAGIIYDEIRRLRTANPSIPLYAVVEDICASGGYYIATTGDVIVAQPGTLTGSIGIFAGKFVIDGTLEKLGVNSETVLSGADADIYSPFAPFSERQRGKLDRFRRVGRYDVAFRLQENRWNGTVAPQLVVQRIFDADAHYGDRVKMAFAFARLINQEARALQADGVDTIQFDEPAFNVYMDEVPSWGIEALHRAIRVERQCTHGATALHG